MDWNTANKFCKARLGDLVSIHSEKEADFLKCSIVQNLKSNAWIGGYKPKGSANKWQWTDGSAYDYFNWFITQPDNLADKFVCVHMNRKYGFKWVDGNCKKKLPFICKQKFF